MEVTVNDILYVILTAAVPVVLRYVYQLVSAKLADSKYRSAVEAVFSAVEYVNQTFVDSLKQSGSFDKEAQEHALKAAKDAAMSTISGATRKWLEKSFVDLDSWLEVQIEAAVRATKPAKEAA